MMIIKLPHSELVTEMENILKDIQRLAKYEKPDRKKTPS